LLWSWVSGVRIPCSPHVKALLGVLPSGLLSRAPRGALSGAQVGQSAWRQLSPAWNGGWVHLTSTEPAILVGAVPALLGAGVGASLTGGSTAGARPKADRDRLRQDAAELPPAGGDLALNLQSVRARHLGPLAEDRRVLKVVFDIFARVDPDAWKDWRTARDNASPGCSPGGSALITSDRAELRETALAATPAMSRIYL